MNKQYQWIIVLVIYLMGINISIAQPTDANNVNNNSGKITAIVELERPFQVKYHQKLIEGLIGPLHVNYNEILKVRLTMLDVTIGKEIQIEAPHGGWLGYYGKPLKWLPTNSQPILNFQYQLGAIPGKYTITFRQGGRIENIDLWVGPSKPIGEAGPVRSFNQ